MNGKLIFNDNDFTVILNVNKDLFDFEKVREFAQKENLFEKFEMHLTIVGRKIGEEIQLNFSNFWGEIKNIIKNMDWDFLIEKSFYFITKKYEEYGGEIRKSIIQIVKFPCLKEFYKKLNGLLSINFEVPFSHVTLFSTSTNLEKKFRGIGIYSSEQFKNLKPELIK